LIPSTNWRRDPPRPARLIDRDRRLWRHGSRISHPRTRRRSGQAAAQATLGELYGISHPHFHEDPCAMGFYRALGNAEFGCDDLVGCAARDIGRDFAFPSGQCVQQEIRRRLVSGCLPQFSHDGPLLELFLGAFWHDVTRPITASSNRSHPSAEMPREGSGEASCQASGPSRNSRLSMRRVVPSRAAVSTTSGSPARISAMVGVSKSRWRRNAT